MRFYVIFIVLASFMLGSCGFKPLYGTYGEKAEVLQNVWIDRIRDEQGQALRNHLIDRFYSDGYPQAARYNLQITLSNFTRSLDVQKDDTTSRAQLIIRAKYQLIDRQTNRAVHEATIRSVNSYNILASQFTTTVTQEDAEDRALRDLADKLKTRITLFLTEEIE